MQFVVDMCGVYVLTVLTCVLKQQEFSGILLFLLDEAKSILHVPMNIDNFLIMFEFFV